MEKRPSIKADTMHVDELVSRARQGRIRVPRFQRGLKWRDTDVQKLFDSLHRGFPIGTLLMWKRPADQEDIAFGPYELLAPATEDAWWVVDGQQRLTSLVAGLLHPDPDDPDDPFVVYYDLKPGADQAPFFRPHRLRQLTPYCIPLARCLDAADFQQWLFDFVAVTNERELIEPASDVATRIRNYRVPIYVVETDDADVARQIFLRTNQAGRRMDAHEVFAALAPTSTVVDLRPETIAERLAGILGPIEPNVVAKAARALVSDDVTRRDAYPEVSEHEPWMRDTERALEAALQFLRACRIPHTRLLPAVPTPLITLARFFYRHPQPSDRSRRLLRRWLWRGFFADALASDAKTLRRAVVAVTDHENDSVQRLLGQVPRETTYTLPSEFDARSSMARLAALVMALQQPYRPAHQRSLFEADAGDDNDVFEWIRRHDAHVFASFPGAPNVPASRFVTPGTTSARLRDQLRAWAASDVEHPALASHLVRPNAARALLADDSDSFIALRTAALQQAADRLYQSMAEPNQSDRPPLAAVMG